MDDDPFMNDNYGTIEDGVVISSVVADDGLSYLRTKMSLVSARWHKRPEPTNEENTVEALNTVRRWQFTEYDPKLGCSVPTRFCKFNTALFDFDKECEYIQNHYVILYLSIDWIGGVN